MGRAATRVLLAEARPAVRDGLARVLEEDGFRICATAADGPSAVSLAVREKPHVCILSLDIPGDPLRAIAEVTASLPDTPVLALTESRTRESLLEAVRAGASGYLLMDMHQERIPNAVRGVLAGEAAVPRVLVGRLLKEIQGMDQVRTVDGPKGPVELSPRQWQVLNLCADRLTTVEIARRLGISAVTVRRHLADACAKLQVGTRAEAVELLDQAP